MTKSKILALCATAIAIAACGGNATDRQTVAFDSVKYENKANNINVTIKVDYPVSGDGILANAIREYISETLGGTYTGDLANADSLLAYYGKTQADTIAQWLDNRPNEGPELLCFFDIKKAYENDRYVTLTTYSESYTGGAHGMQATSGITFRKSDGRRFGYDMLRNTDGEAFHKLIKEGLRQYFKEYGQPVETDSQLKEMLLTDDDIDYLSLPTTQPYVTADSIVFIYQPYEIAPYACGEPTFTIPLDKMKDYLTETAVKMLK